MRVPRKSMESRDGTGLTKPPGPKNVSARSSGASNCVVNTGVQLCVATGNAGSGARESGPSVPAAAKNSNDNPRRDGGVKLRTPVTLHSGVFPAKTVKDSPNTPSVMTPEYPPIAWKSAPSTCDSNVRKPSTTPLLSNEPNPSVSRTTRPLPLSVASNSNCMLGPNSTNCLSAVDPVSVTPLGNAVHGDDSMVRLTRYGPSSASMICTNGTKANGPFPSRSVSSARSPFQSGSARTAHNPGRTSSGTVTVVVPVDVAPEASPGTLRMPTTSGGNGPGAPGTSTGSMMSAMPNGPAAAGPWLLTVVVTEIVCAFRGVLRRTANGAWIESVSRSGRGGVVTTKSVALTAAPAALVTLIFDVFASRGTTTVSSVCDAESTLAANVPTRTTGATIGSSSPTPKL